MLRIALLLGLLTPPALAEIPEPFPKYTLTPVAQAYPAFARGDEPTFTVRAHVLAPLDAAWKVMKDQGKLLNTMTYCKQIFNLTGPPGEWLIVVQWHTPVKWHRWTRTDVRKYLYVNDESKTLSYFLVGGFGLWMPRLAFRETLSPGPTPDSSTLTVGVWYELDDKYIGWPTENLKRLTLERWTGWYNQPKVGFAAELAQIATGMLPTVPLIGQGRIQDYKVADVALKWEL